MSNPLEIEQWTEIARRVRNAMDGRSTLDQPDAAEEPEQVAALRAAAEDVRISCTSDLPVLGLTTIEVDQATLDRLRGYYLRTVFGLASGSIVHCPHISIATPVPAVVPVYRDRVDCYNCFCSTVPFSLLSRIEEHTCDLCRILHSDEKMRTVVAQFGCLMLITKICSSCDSS